jgi:hypothetical protein
MYPNLRPINGSRSKLLTVAGRLSLFFLIAFLLPVQSYAEETAQEDQAESSNDAASATAGEVGEEEAVSPLSLTLSVEPTSKYIWRGIDLFPEDKAGISEELYFETSLGIYFAVWGIQSFASENRDLDELDYYVGYTSTALEDSIFETELDLSYLYYDFPRLNRESDSHELSANLKFPSIIPTENKLIAPVFGLYHNFSAETSDLSTTWLRLGMELSPPCPTYTVGEGVTEGTVQILVESLYILDDELIETSRGFSHILTGVSIDLLSWAGLTLSPSVNYQISLKDSINTEDEFWAALKLSFTFP